MGINDLQLSPELIAALYPEILVNAGDPAPVSGPVKPRKPLPAKGHSYSFLGGNRRSLCILVYCPDAEFMPEEQFVFLQKIMAACKYSLDDIAVVNTHRQPMNLENLKSQFSPHVIFLWGSPPPDIPGFPKTLTDMSITTWENMIVLPIAQAVLMSRDNPEGLALKRVLWTSLKKIFNL
jgi:hypothetical protein